MSRADSGGFDLVFELSIPAIRRQIAPLVGAPIPDVTMPVAGWGNLVFQTQFALTELSLRPGCTVRTTVSTAGTELQWPALVFGGVTLAAAGSQPFTFEVTIDATPSASGTSLSLGFANDAASVTIGPGTLEAIPGVLAWLTLVDVLLGGAAREAERARIYADAEAGLAASINGALPASVPLGTLPRPPVGSVEITCAGQELRVLMMIGGNRATANPAAITRSAIRTGPGGVPLDIAGIVIGNKCVLRDILRPVLRSGLGLSAGGFLGNHPCFWVGDVALPAAATVAGVRPRVKTVFTGIDSAGMIRVSMAFDGAHSTGAFGISGSISLGISASIVTTGATRTLRLTVDTSVVTGLDIWVEWWVYVGGIVVSPLLALAIALTDAFAGGALANTINDAVRGALGTGTLALPLPAGGIGPTTLRTFQPDAEAQTISFSGITIPDFPANDIIATIG